MSETIFASERLSRQSIGERVAGRCSVIELSVVKGVYATRVVDPGPEEGGTVVKLASPSIESVLHPEHSSWPHMIHDGCNSDNIGPYRQEQQ